MRTRLVDLLRSIQRRLCRDGRKRLGMIYYRLPISVVAQGVKYGCFAIETDEDLQVLFHCRRQFPRCEPQSCLWRCLIHLRVLVVPLRIHIPPMLPGRLALRSSTIQRSFGELTVAIAAAPHPVSVPVVEKDPELLVEETLRANDSDDEP
ncbi:hypothetical protein PIB30_068493 [Stylosanthes scabra]|uniref:Uncharacterized protein n=1 Tax=Stylosanthes scabra TaxID=79078 RepID=A0ABU6TMN3_9FABA|nr:hypothetical protein [Stylosanthes scabra]